MNERHLENRLRDSISSNEIAAMTKLVRSLERLLDEPSGSNATAPTPQQLAIFAKRLLDLRRSRGRFLDPDMFGEPAWDMILALYIASIEQYRLKVTDLVNESRVPASTGLRWIRRLQEAGLIVRHENPLDGRINFLEISEGGIQKVSSLLEFAQPRYFPSD